MAAAARAVPWQRVRAGDDAVSVAERAALGTSARLVVWPPENLGVACAVVDDVARCIVIVRGRRVMLDVDLARVYGVPPSSPACVR